MDPACHVELIYGVGTGDRCPIGDQVPIQPHIGARDDAVDTEQSVDSRWRFGNGELGAIPPGNHEHGAAGIGLFYGAQIVAVKHVLVLAILQQPGHDSRTAGHGIPAAR